eukprot:1232019-Rhodomonas_salina.1
MNTGDAVQWYFTFEVPCFNRHGRREQRNEEDNLKKDEISRYKYHMRENGSTAIESKKGASIDGKTPAAYPKPYRGNPLTD